MKRKTKVSKPAATQSLIENFEPRLMLSVTLANGTLTVNGTNNADTISVDYFLSFRDVPQQGDDTVTVTVNGTAQTFDTAGLKNIVINGLAGNDLISTSGNFENDSSLSFPNILNISLAGGDGNDRIFADDTGEEATVSLSVDGGNGNDQIDSQGPELVTIHGGIGDDTLSTEAGASDVFASVYGDDGNDSYFSGSSGIAGQQVHVYGGNGNDSFFNGDIDDHDSISGGAGIDTFGISPDISGYSIVPGPYGNSAYFALDGKTHGNDNIGTDVENFMGTWYGNGNITVIGNDLNNYIGVAGGEVESLVGGNGNDTLNSGLHQDVNAPVSGPISSPGNFLEGDAGNDLLIGSAGANHYSGGSGTDSVDYTKRTANLKIYLDGSQLSGAFGSAFDKFDGTVEQVFGGSGNDYIVATKSGGDALFGFAGNDTLVAQGGIDALFGGDGNDTFQAKDGGFTYIDGGAGKDTAKTDLSDTTISVEIVTH